MRPLQVSTKAPRSCGIIAFNWKVAFDKIFKSRISLGLGLLRLRAPVRANATAISETHFCVVNASDFADYTYADYIAVLLPRCCGCFSAPEFGRPQATLQNTLSLSFHLTVGLLF